MSGSLSAGLSAAATGAPCTAVGGAGSDATAGALCSAGGGAGSDGTADEEDIGTRAGGGMESGVREVAGSGGTGNGNRLGVTVGTFMMYCGVVSCPGISPGRNV